MFIFLNSWLSQIHFHELAAICRFIVSQSQSLFMFTLTFGTFLLFDEKSLEIALSILRKIFFKNTHALSNSLLIG